VGTDALLTVVQNIRNRIISLGGEVRFCTQVTDLLMDEDRLVGLRTADGEEIPCDTAVLAIGHSARDTFRMLEQTGIGMEPKAFSMGVRIEVIAQRDLGQTEVKVTDGLFTFVALDANHQPRPVDQP
jgi:uncharacterized FAD-dependent dehydrogenase